MNTIYTEEILYDEELDVCKTNLLYKGNNYEDAIHAMKKYKGFNRVEVSCPTVEFCNGLLAHNNKYQQKGGER